MQNILFDLDGTLLPQDQDEFIKVYFTELTKKFGSLGYDTNMFLVGLNLGIKAMLINDGQMTNEDVFWISFTKVTNIKKEDVEEEFTNFYINDFQIAGKDVIPYPGLNEALQNLKNKGYKLFLATNPLFPKIATLSRIKWAGLNNDLFEFITTYENSHYSKPNPLYYQEILDKFNLNPNDTLMIGNDLSDDLVINKLGVSVHIVTDYLINKDGIELPDTFSSMKQLIKHFNSL